VLVQAPYKHPCEMRRCHYLQYISDRVLVECEVIKRTLIYLNSFNCFTLYKNPAANVLQIMAPGHFARVLVGSLYKHPDAKSMQIMCLR
jgi:hypothetical protein